MLRQKQAMGILEIVQQTYGSARGRGKSAKDNATVADFDGEYDDFVYPFGSVAATELRQHTPLTPVFISHIRQDTPKSSSIQDGDIRLMYEQEAFLANRID